MKKLILITLISTSIIAVTDQAQLLLESEDSTPNANHHIHRNNLNLYHPSFAILQQHEKGGLKDHLEDAAWQIGASTAAHLLTSVVTDAYQEWKKPEEIKTAEKIHLHNTLEGQIQNLREIIVNFYKFVASNSSDENIIKNTKKATLLSLSNIRARNLNKILAIIHKLNGIQAQYDLEDTTANKMDFLELFVNEFNNLLTLING